VNPLNSHDSKKRSGIGGWWAPCLRQSLRSAVRSDKPIHVLICIVDHYEPGLGGASNEQADERVRNWVEKYPKLFSGFRDSDGQPPRHTFFYPLEMYREQEVTQVAQLCRAGFGEIEVHLHHDNDTSENLRRALLEYKQRLHEKHGVLARRKSTGEIQYAFIHGNWALDNSRPDGKWCGVNNELDILRETGCYADFTLPSFPSPTQTRKINSIYYATDDPNSAKSHDSGIDVGSAQPPENSLMLIQGPLLMNWKSRKWGLIPRIENACIQGNQPPTMNRLKLWLNARVQIPTKPDWFFVKLHTHGAPESNQTVLLGEPMTQFHQALANRAKQDPNFNYHYVTAREMYNLAKAAEANWNKSVNQARDFDLICDNSTMEPVSSHNKSSN